MLPGYISCLAVSVALHAFVVQYIEDIQEGLRWNLFKLFKAKKHAQAGGRSYAKTKNPLIQKNQTTTCHYKTTY